MARIVFGASPSEPEERGQEQETTRQATSAEVEPAELEVAPAAELAGHRVGHYKLLEQIGEGGFGVVYMAEQVEPVQRKVALKIIKPGMDSRAIIARFEAERQALALMDHPNIARVLDAGTTKTGRPYFVMELVRGLKITTYCDQQRLSTPERLQLFINVCHAVQHAHQKGIIHRDLKPSNMLVTLHDGKPVPKVIDFGIAKALGQKLTDKTLFTGFAQLLGTPAYMSPEQAELSGLDVDTRSDIYSLGVLLYELLTGVTPFDLETLAKAALDEIRRLIRETDPPKPSTRLQTLGAKATEVAKHRRTEPTALTRLIRGELDWIVMKCLEKDRQRRYDTANSLAQDVQRHLNHEPVQAAAPSLSYRARKFTRRHRTALAMAATLLVLLVAGTTTSTFEAIRALRAERRASQAAQFLQDMLEGVGPSVALGRDTTLLREVLDRTVERVTRDLNDQPDVQADLLSTAGRVYWALGQPTNSESLHRKALDLRRRADGEESLAVAESLDNLTEALWSQGRLSEAEAAERHALAIRRKLLPKDHPNVATSLNNLGVVLGYQKKLREAESLLEQALAIEQSVLKPQDERIAETLTALSSLFWQQGKLREAEKMDRDVVAIYRGSRGEDDPEVAKVLNNLGTVLRSEGKLDDAKTVLQQALAIQRKILPADHPDRLATVNNLAGVLWQRGELPEAETLWREFLELETKARGRQTARVADGLNSLGNVLRQKGEFDEAKKVASEAVAIKRKLSPPEDPDLAVYIYDLAGVLWDLAEFASAEAAYQEEIGIFQKVTNRIQVARGSNNLATVWRDQGRLAEAEQAHRGVLQMQKDTLGELHEDIAASLNNLAYVLKIRHQPAKAEPLFQQAVAMLKRVNGNDSPLLILPLSNLADLFRQENKLTEAETIAKEYLSVCEKQPSWDWRRFEAQSALGEILTAEQNFEGAEPLLLSGYEGLQQHAQQIPPRISNRSKRAVQRIVDLYEASGRPDKASDWKAKLVVSQEAKPEK